MRTFTPTTRQLDIDKPDLPFTVLVHHDPVSREVSKRRFDALMSQFPDGEWKTRARYWKIPQEEALPTTQPTAGRANGAEGV